MPSAREIRQRRRRRGRGLVCAAASVAALTACTSDAPDRSTSTGSAPTSSGSPSSATGELISQLEVPWDMEHLPDGRLLVSLRDRGEVLAVAEDGASTSLGTVPGVVPGGEGGLLGLALSPGFATDHAIYAYFTAEADNRVARCSLTDAKIERCAPVLTGLAKADFHNGGRIAFGPDGALYVGTGDAGDKPNAQNPSSLNGKILRIDVAKNAAPEVYSLGHRNVQGLAWLPDGTMVASEFGQNTWDELNVIVKGGNYGWPEVEGVARRDGFIDPVAAWPTSEASPSGITVGPDGSVYLAALRGESVWRVPFTGATAGKPERFLQGKLGRIRDVLVDGSDLLVMSNNTFRGSPRPGDDRIVRVPLPLS